MCIGNETPSVKEDERERKGRNKRKKGGKTREERDARKEVRLDKNIVGKAVKQEGRCKTER